MSASKHSMGCTEQTWYPDNYGLYDYTFKITVTNSGPEAITITLFSYTQQGAAAIKNFKHEPLQDAGLSNPPTTPYLIPPGGSITYYDRFTWEKYYSDIIQLIFRCSYYQPWVDQPPTTYQIFDIMSIDYYP
jgi:hypothetical protein